MPSHDFKFCLPAVLQIALFEIFLDPVGVHLYKVCIIVPDLGVLKIALLKTIFLVRDSVVPHSHTLKDKPLIFLNLDFFESL